MPIQVACGKCQKKYKLPDRVAGKRVKCPNCKTAISVPAPAVADAPLPVAEIIDDEPAPKRTDDLANSLDSLINELDQPSAPKPIASGTSDSESPFSTAPLPRPKKPIKHRSAPEVNWVRFVQPGLFFSMVFIPSILIILGNRVGRGEQTVSLAFLGFIGVAFSIFVAAAVWLRENEVMSKVDMLIGRGLVILNMVLTVFGLSKSLFNAIMIGPSFGGWAVFTVIFLVTTLFFCGIWAMFWWLFGLFGMSRVGSVLFCMFAILVIGIQAIGENFGPRGDSPQLARNNRNMRDDHGPPEWSRAARERASRDSASFPPSNHEPFPNRSPSARRGLGGSNRTSPENQHDFGDWPENNNQTFRQQEEPRSGASSSGAVDNPFGSSEPASSGNSSTFGSDNNPPAREDMIARSLGGGGASADNPFAGSSSETTNSRSDTFGDSANAGASNPFATTRSARTVSAGAYPTVDQAYEAQVRETLNAMYVGLIAGDGQTLVERTRWQEATGEATLGLRWGVGVHVAGFGNGLDIDSQPELEHHTGSIGPALVSRLQSRIDQGDFGDWSGEDKLLSLIPVFGGGNLSEVRGAARRLGLDGLIMISVRERSATQTRQADSTLIIQVTDLNNPRRHWSSGQLSKSQVESASARGKNLSETFVAKILAHVDQDFALETPPTLDARKVQARVTAINKSTQPLRRTLSELRFYQESNQLSDADAARAYGKSLDRADGETLATGTAAERREVVSQWLKNQL